MALLPTPNPTCCPHWQQFERDLADASRLLMASDWPEFFSRVSTLGSLVSHIQEIGDLPERALAIRIHHRARMLGALLRSTCLRARTMANLVNDPTGTYPRRQGG